METGADATRFIQQYKSFGLKDKIPMVGAMNVADQSVIRTLGDEALDIVSCHSFAEGAHDDGTKTFVAQYEARYQKLPSVFGTNHYAGGMWLTEAITKIGGKVEDRDVFLKAVREVELKGSPLGPVVKMDAYGHPVYTAFIRKVAEARRRQAVERSGHQLPERLAVLDLRSRDLHEAAALLAHVPGHKELTRERACSAARLRPLHALRIAADVSTPILQLENVSVRFGALPAVDGVSLDLRQGERRAVIGPNGAGKTTLFNAITGVIRPSSGRVAAAGAQHHAHAAEPARPPRHRPHLPDHQPVRQPDGCGEHAPGPARHVAQQVPPVCRRSPRRA